MLTLTPSALLLIKEWEQFKPQTYFDSAGVPTIGFGITKFSNGDRPAIGDEISEDEAEAELFHYIRNSVEPTLTAHFDGVPLQPNQRDALGSFLYNLGGNAKKWPTLKKLIHAEAPSDAIADQFMKYRKAGGKVLLGLHRRRLAEALVWLGMGWDQASGYARNASLEQDWRAFAPQTIDTPDIDAEIFEELEIPKRGNAMEPITDPTPETPLTTADLNNMSLESSKTGRPIDYGVPLTSMSKKVPVEAVQYLADEDKQPGNITVKRIEDSKRGKGYAKSEMGKSQIIVGAGGTAAAAIGAAEPVVKFVDRYSFNTIATVFIALTVLGVILYAYGKWERERGEDEAEDVLG